MSDKAKNNNMAFWRYVALPLVFLSVCLLGGMRLSLETNAFIFLAPSLFNLVLAVMLVAAIVRGRLITVENWFSPDFTPLKNIANGLIVLTLFFASVQALNSILPEKGFAFVLTAFFLLWTLWTNLFAELKAEKLLRSLAALFGLAFVFKYVFLASLVASPADESWMRKLTESLLQGVSLGLLEIPKYSGVTGYVAFFTLILYAAGLLLLSSISNSRSESGSSLIVVSDTTS